jgi:hypothetical protein
MQVLRIITRRRKKKQKETKKNKKKCTRKTQDTMDVWIQANDRTKGSPTCFYAALRTAYCDLNDEISRENAREFCFRKNPPVNRFRFLVGCSQRRKTHLSLHTYVSMSIGFLCAFSVVLVFYMWPQRL